MNTPCPEYLLRHLRRLVPPPASDAGLLDAFVRRRDEDSFSALVARHGPMVFGVCRRVLPDWGEAEDATQATFLVLARRAAAIGRPDALAAWLHGTAHRLALAARREGARRRRRETRSFLAAEAVPRPDPLEEITGRELLGIIDEELGRLPEVYRSPLILCYLEGHTQEEAARRLGWTPDSVRGRLERGHAKLHGRLVRRGLASGAPALLEASRGIVSATGLPGRFVASTVRAGLAFSATAAGTAGSVVPRVAALAEEAMRNMAVVKMKVVLVLLLAAGVVAAGAGVVAHQGAIEPKPAQRDRPQPAVKADEGPPVRADRFGDPLPEGAIQRLGTVRFRSPGGVECVVFTPDGKGLLSTCWDGNVRLWDSVTGKELRRFGGHSRGVRKVDVSSDGKTLATKDFDGVVRLWDFSSGKARVVTLGRPARGPLALSPKADFLATAGSNGTLRLWDTATGREIRRLGPLASGGEMTSLQSVAFSPDGRLVAAGTGSGKEIPDRPGMTRVWDVATGKALHTLGGHRSRVMAVAFGPGGKLLASSSNDDTICLWNTTTGKKLVEIEVPAESDSRLDNFSAAMGLRGEGARCLAFSPDGKLLASAHQDGTVRSWESATGKALRTLRGHGRQATSVAFSADGKALASASLDHTIRVWDPATGKLLSPRQGHDGGVTRIAVARDGKRAATAGYDRTVRLWDLASGRELAVLRSPAGTTLETLALSPDGKSLATGGGRTICLWDVATGKVVRRLEGHAGDVRSLSFSPDGKTLASAATEIEKQSVRLWDVTTGREVRPVEATGYFCSVRFSSDGKWLASDTHDKGVYVWDAATGKRRHRFEGQIAFAFLPDGKSLVGWGEADEVSVLSLGTGRKVYGFQGPNHIKHLGVSFDLSPDGRLLAFFPRAKDLQVWELATGKLRSTFASATSFGGLAFTPDGRTLLSSRQDTTALAWGLAGQAERARPGLTEKEFAALWADLAADDGERAGRAVRSLIVAGGRSVAFLKPRLRPTRAVEPARVSALVADLDADRSADRDKATRELDALGELAESALRKAREGTPSPEARRRLDRLLAAAAGPIAVAEKARAIRAVEVLERVGTREAAEVLRDLAAGAPSAWLTREARAALARLARPRDVP